MSPINHSKTKVRPPYVGFLEEIQRLGPPVLGILLLFGLRGKGFTLFYTKRKK